MLKVAIPYAPGGTADTVVLTAASINQPERTTHATIVILNVGGCDCGLWGDISADEAINPLDVTFIVNYVYKDLDQRTPLPGCPYDPGDVNCDYAVNPLDVVHYVNYVYKNITPWPCEGCL